MDLSILGNFRQKASTISILLIGFAFDFHGWILEIHPNARLGSISRFLPFRCWFLGLIFFFSATSVKHLIFVDFLWCLYSVRLWFSWLDRGNSAKCIFGIDFMILAISGWISWCWRMFVKHCQQNRNFVDFLWFLYSVRLRFSWLDRWNSSKCIFGIDFMIASISGWITWCWRIFAKKRHQFQFCW